MITFLFSTTGIIQAEEKPCSQHSKVFPLKYNECMKKLKNNNTATGSKKIKMPGLLKNLNQKYKDLREKAPKTLIK